MVRNDTSGYICQFDDKSDKIMDVLIMEVILPTSTLQVYCTCNWNLLFLHKYKIGFFLVVDISGQGFSAPIMELHLK
ncbi:MAG: hypothetical protein CM15mV32_0140 [Caudoviricetes sp.]|nr:MAG: hypothetical protein CM15mV32_0140 [Caudoviricetes sp.]